MKARKNPTRNLFICKCNEFPKQLTWQNGGNQTRINIFAHAKLNEILKKKKNTFPDAPSFPVLYKLPSPTSKQSYNLRVLTFCSVLFLFLSYNTTSSTLLHLLSTTSELILSTS